MKKLLRFDSLAWIMINALVFYHLMTFDSEKFLGQLSESKFYIHVLISLAFGIVLTYLLYLPNIPKK